MNLIWNIVLLLYAVAVLIIIPIVANKIIKRLKGRNNKTSTYMWGSWVGMLLLGLSYAIGTYVFPQTEYYMMLAKTIWRVLELVVYIFGVFIYQDKSPLILIKDPTIICKNNLLVSKSTHNSKNVSSNINI